MIQYPLHGSYSPSQLVMVGAFKTVTSGNPTVLRDGTKVSASQKMFSVTRNSAGLYTVTFASGFPLPRLPFIYATLHQAAAPTNDAVLHVVRDSWNTSTRSFQVQIQTNGTTPAATDGDAGDVVSFMLVGAIDSVGVDPA
jgi:hypothetical protein